MIEFSKACAFGCSLFILGVVFGFILCALIHPKTRYDETEDEEEDHRVIHH